LIGASALTLSNFGAYSTKPQIATSGDKAVVAWQYDNNSTVFATMGRFVDLNPLTPVGNLLIGSNEFQISDASTSYPENVQLIAAGDRVLFVYDALSMAMYAKEVILPGVLPLAEPVKYGANNFFIAPLIERNYIVTSKIKF